MKNGFQILKSLHFTLIEEKESIEKIIKNISLCVVLHNFLIAENDECNSFFYEKDKCASDINSDNELNYIVNDSIDEEE